MRLLPALFLLSLAARGDEIDKARTDLGTAFRAYDRAGANRAAAALAKLNAEPCPEAFVADFKIGLDAYAEIKKEQQKWAREMEVNELYRDEKGRLVSRGDSFKYLTAKRNFDLISPKVEALESAIPHSMLHLSRLSSPATAKGLEEIVRGAPDWLPRAAAADALAKIDAPEALDALLARARSEESPNARVALAGALGFKAATSEDAKKLLAAWLENPFWQVRLSAAQAIARAGDKKMTPLLISQLRSTQGRLKHEINECLKTLTGVNKHGDFAAWKAWWDKYSGEVLEGTYKIQTFEQADEKGITSFYGIPFNSSRVVFILDISESMKEEARWKPDAANDSDKLEGKRRLDVAKYELRKIIRGMPDGASFNIITISTNVALLSEQMVVAEKKTREKALGFIQALQVGAGTNLHGALVRSFEFAGGSWNAPLKQDSIDTVYLISDGIPTFGVVTDREMIVERAVDTLRYKKIVIHSIGIEVNATGRVVMKGLAEGTGGQYVER